MTMNGSPVRAGDFFASGTMSGDGPAEAGSLTEMTDFGTEPIRIGSDVRGYLEDGDEVILRGHAQVGGATVHLGDVAGTVLPAIG